MKQILLVAVLTVVMGILLQWFAEEKEKLLAIIILSSRQNFDHRKSLRDTWLEDIAGNEMITYKFAIGREGCSIHPKNRRDHYSCQNLQLTESVNSTDFPLLIANKSSCISDHVFPVWNMSFAIHHPVIVKRLGVSSAVILHQISFTVAIYDDFREETVVSVQFNHQDQGTLINGYRYQSIEPVMFPTEFKGSLRIFENKLKLNVSDCYNNVTNNSGGVVELMYKDNKDFPKHLPSHVGIPMVSMHLSISEISVLKNRVNQQTILDDQQIKYEKEIAEKLHAESVQYGDIIFLNIVDVYRNLPEKLLKSHQWLSKSLNFKFILKTDDDCYVNMPLLIETLQQYSNEDRMWWGNFRYNWFVERYGKWAEPHYRGDEYPAFACGSGNIMSQRLSKWISMNGDHLHQYQGEDVSMGIWLSAVQTVYVDDPRWKCEKECKGDAITIPELSVQDIYSYRQNQNLCGNLCSCEEE